MRKFTILAVAVLSLAGCKAGSSSTNESTTDASSAASTLTPEEAGRIVDQAYGVFASGDPAKMMNLYAPDAVLIDAGHNQPTTDRATITKWTAGFAEMHPSDFTTNPRIIQSFNDDTIVSSGILAFLGDVGARRQRLTVRYTHVFERQADGRWLIVAEHNSLPPEPMVPGV